MEKIKLLSLFSGIGAFEKALENIDIEYELVGFSEIDKYAIESYSAIHGVSTDLNLGDISKIKSDDIPKADLITYGFPCQDISVAGLGRGIVEGETRSGLLFDALRIIKEKKPKYAIAENVKNLVGKKFKDDFNSLLEELDSYGYNNYWQVLNAKDYGIPQNRERVFVVSIRKDVDKGYEFPKPFDNGLRLKDLLEDEVEDKYYIDNDRTSILLSNLKDKNLLNGERFGADSTVNDTDKREISNCIIARYDAGIVNQKQVGMVIAEPIIVASRGRNPSNPSDRTVGSPTEQRLEPNTQGITNTLTTVQKDNLVLEPKRLGGLYDTDTKRRQAGAVWDQKNIAPTIDTCQGGHREPLIVENAYRVRKLTPKECFRLMGFENDDYWKARVRLEKVFYNGNDRSNSQMYKMAGNSIVVDVLEGILKNLILKDQ